MGKAHFRNYTGAIVHYVMDDASGAEHCRTLAREATTDHWRAYWEAEAAAHDGGILHRQRLALGLVPARAEDCACYHGRGCAPV